MDKDKKYKIRDEDLLAIVELVGGHRPACDDLVEIATGNLPQVAGLSLEQAGLRSQYTISSTEEKILDLLQKVQDRLFRQSMFLGHAIGG